ncbi:hypothetical protein [Methanosarcina sp.]|nr:hypothetical protein [Methanosarcina sp.]MDW5549009.1 hypothetical protein [Methanosarcina sp.]MDW5552712.1 hypothetical protein [Methanosarcina sp.]
MEKNIKDQLKSSAIMLREVTSKFFWRKKELLLKELLLKELLLIQTDF